MSEFVPVARISDLPDPGRVLVEIGERMVVLCHVGGEFFCLDDVCTHDGGPLGDGQLDGYELICPRHGARFDIRNGCAKTMPATEDTRVYEVRVEGETILVRFNDNA